MDVLLVGGAWALGSVAVSLVLGAVVARAERPVELTATTAPAGQVPTLPALPALPALAPLPAPRSSLEQVAATAS